MIAGSICRVFAPSGRIHPMILDRITVAVRDRETTRASLGSLYIIRMRIPFMTASPVPTRSAIRNSLNAKHHGDGSRSGQDRG